MEGIKGQKVSKTKSFFKKVREVFKRKNPMEDEVSFPGKKRRFAFRSTVAGLTFLMLTPFISKGVQDVLTFFNTDYTKMPSAVVYAQDMNENRLEEIKKEALKHLNIKTGKWDIVDTVEVSKEDVDKAFSMTPKYELTGEFDRFLAWSRMERLFPLTDKESIEKTRWLWKKMREERNASLLNKELYEDIVEKSRVFQIPVESQWGDKFIITVRVNLGVDKYYIDALIEREGQTEKPLKIVLPWVAYSQLLGIDTDEILEPSNGINSIKIGFEIYYKEEKVKLDPEVINKDATVLTTGLAIVIGLDNKNGKNPYNGFFTVVEISLPRKDAKREHQSLSDYFYYSPDALIYYKAKEPLTLSKR